MSQFKILITASLFLIMFTFMACQEEKEAPASSDDQMEEKSSDSTANSQVHDEVVPDPENKNPSLSDSLDDYVGEYVCCPNENARDEIQVPCDNMVPSSYALSIHEDNLVFVSMYWQDFTADTCDQFHFVGDTLVMTFNKNGESFTHKIGA